MQDDLSYLAAIDRIAKLETQVAELARWKAVRAAEIDDDNKRVWAAETRVSELETMVQNQGVIDGNKITFLETLLEEARKALAPFIRLADNVFSDGKNATVADEVTLWCFNDTDITFGDLRRVRAIHDRIDK